MGLFAGVGGCGEGVLIFFNFLRRFRFLKNKK